MKLKNPLHFLAVAVLLSGLHASTTFALQCTDRNYPQACGADCIAATSICILEPLPGGGIREIPSGRIGFDSFFDYINGGVWQWAFMMGTAIAVLNGTIAGFQIATSNGDSGKVDAGKTRFISSAIGLVILILAGVILNFINPAGFTT